MPAAKLTRTINGLALAISAAIMVALPLGHWLIAYESMLVGMKQEATVDAALVSKLINRNPDFWQFEEHRLVEFVTTDIDHATPDELRSILDRDGKIIVQNQIELPAPIVTLSAALYDSGRPVGQFEVSRSLRPLIQETALMAMLGLALAAAIFATLKMLPLRALGRALDSLREEKEKAQVTLASIADAVLTTDALGHIQYLNHVAETLTGVHHDDAVGKPLLDALTLSGDAGPLARSPLADFNPARGSSIRGTGLLTRHDGCTLDIAFAISPIRDDKGALSGSVVVFRDMTESRRARDELVASEERLRAIVDNAIDGIITFDAETRRVTSLNPAAIAIFGYTSEEAVELKIDALIPTLETPAEIHRTETSGLSKEGKQVALELSVSKARLGDRRAWVATVHDLTARKEVEATAAFLANYDGLTSLPNRSLFHDRLKQALQRAQRNQQFVGLMILDIDNFKTINDSLGHTRGDELLQQVAQRLELLLRRSDTVARQAGDGTVDTMAAEGTGTTLSRQGGDEFTIILEGIARPEILATIARKVMENFSAPFSIDGRDIFITTSIGIAVYPTDNLNPEGLIRCADSAMYRAKEQGHGTFDFYTEDMNVRSSERLALEADLRHALAREEFLLHYQPKVDTATGRIVGMEALLRWQSPQRGLVSPLEFIPLLEETGQIVPVGEWVLRTACKQISAWQQAGMPALQVAVNISARQFKHPGLLDAVTCVLTETGISPKHLELELTESMLMERVDASVALMRQLNQLGIHISIDDFGTGYSSLGYLKRFPIQKLKIDRSFVRDVTTDPNDAAIATGVIALAHSLQLKVVAEGVENEEQLEFLRERQCDQIQGYFFSRPLPPDAFEKWVRAKTSTQS